MGLFWFISNFYCKFFHMTHILAMGGTLHGQLRCIQSLYSSQTYSSQHTYNPPTSTSPRKVQKLKFEKKLNQANIWTVGKGEGITTVVVLSKIENYYWQSLLNRIYILTQLLNNLCWETCAFQGLYPERLWTFFQPDWLFLESVY